jgi:hypothetical protein
MHTYKLDEPRIAIQQVDEHNEPIAPAHELGQCETLHEALFFCSIGYRVDMSRWDGQKFSKEESYLPADLH